MDQMYSHPQHLRNSLRNLNSQTIEAVSGERFRVTAVSPALEWPAVNSCPVANADEVFSGLKVILDPGDWFCGGRILPGEGRGN